MAERLVPIPYEQAEGSNSYKVIQEQLDEFSVRMRLEDALTQELGPLTVKERWDLFEEDALKAPKENTSLEGGARQVASRFIQKCVGYGYPANVAILHFLDVVAELEQIAPELKPHVDALLTPAE